MPVETGETIAQLDDTWPLSGDAIPEGDDHIRLIKSVLKDQFPGSVGNGFNKAITATEDEINHLSGVTSGIQDQLDAEVTNRTAADDALDARVSALEAADHNDAAYPVGSVYFAAVGTNPATLLGVGTWARIAQGRFIVGQGQGTDSNTFNRTYGEGNDLFGEYQHTLTAAELASHTHEQNGRNVRGAEGGDAGHNWVFGDNELGGAENPGSTNPSGYNTLAAGNDQPHENSPPAFGLYIWQRTA